MPVLNKDEQGAILNSVKWIGPNMTVIQLSVTVKNLTLEPPHGRRVKVNPTHHQPVLRREKQLRGKGIWEVTKSGKGPASTAKPWEWLTRHFLQNASVTSSMKGDENFGPDIKTKFSKFWILSSPYLTWSQMKEMNKTWKVTRGLDEEAFTIKSLY